jgi:hypothetical protein
MPVLSVSLDGDMPNMRTVQPRTAKITAGVLCEVWADERLQLCIVDRVNADGSIAARRLPRGPVGETDAAMERRSA